MKKSFFLLIVLAVSLGSCVKNHLAGEAEKEDCTEDVLVKYNMEAASEHPSTLSCYNYLNLYLYKGVSYYQWGGSCEDYILNPEDCEGVKLCTDPLDPSCDEKIRALELIGLIGTRQ